MPKKFTEDNFNGLNFDGIYLVGYRNTITDKRHIIYVGQGNIGARLVKHYNENGRIKEKIRNGGAGYYRFSKCQNENDRLDIELGLYNKYGGKKKLCNEVEPPGSGRNTVITVQENYK